MRRKTEFLVLVLAMLLAIPSCGPRPVTGGTPGTLRAGGEPTQEIQVTVHFMKDGTTRPIGFGVTAADGSFQLVEIAAKGPLALPPGDYRFTLESAGSPVQIPPEYAEPNTSPLTVSWSLADSRLVLELPNRLVIQ